MHSITMSWMHQVGIFVLFTVVSAMDPGPQLVQLQEQVEELQQENMENRERIVNLERRVSLLESVCGSSEMETEISGPIMAIGGYDGSGNGGYKISSAEVLNTSCDFPLPEARWGHMSVTTADGKTLVCGGTTPSGRATSCLIFDYESKSWKERSPLLSQYRFLASAVTLSRGTYVLQGEDKATSSSEFLATGSSVWTQGPDVPGDGVYKSCVAKMSDTEFIILGGIRHEYQALVYNEEEDTWRRLPNLNVGVFGHSCVTLGDIVLIAGGFSDYANTGRTFIFDTKTGSAREVASLKYPRAFAAMVLYGGKPLILGGEDDSRETRSDGEIWNMDTETWEEADIHLDIARRSYSMVTMAEEIACD